jgi:hypothetical protein
MAGWIACSIACDGRCLLLDLVVQLPEAHGALGRLRDSSATGRAQPSMRQCRLTVIWHFNTITGRN